MPPGDAQPLHVLMSELLTLAGARLSDDPREIFKRIGQEIPAYSGIDYDSIGSLGAAPAQAAEEVLR
jgi:hypothetical protein